MAILTSLTLLTSGAFCYGQDVNRLEKKRPHIYLTLDKSEKDQNIFSFHNNSPWPVQVCVRAYYPPPFLDKKVVNGKEGLFLKTDKAQRLCYGVETYSAWRVVSSQKSDPAPKPKDDGSKDPCALKPTYIYYDDNHAYKQFIAPGDALSFDIPAKYLAEGSAIYITYQYDWEEYDYTADFRGPDHRVYFYDFVRRSNTQD
ncbi:MAG TPA: hypothetical protein VK666_19840 [Chryseolinea sp.]|nr:hypothetical protein [Chryseolinea sp.]